MKTEKSQSHKFSEKHRIPRRQLLQLFLAEPSLYYRKNIGFVLQLRNMDSVNFFIHKSRDDIKLARIGNKTFSKGRRTFTVIGTPHYMAPKILNGKSIIKVMHQGYSYYVDLWSIAICLYEFMCGGVPFAEDAEDPYEIQQEVTKKQISYPNHLKDRKAKKFIDQLLNKTPEIRLGGSYAALKVNTQFDGLDWVFVIQSKFLIVKNPNLNVW